MLFFYLLLILLILLLVLTILTSIIRFALFLTTKCKYETNLLIVPAILNISVWSILLFLWSKIILKTTNKDIVTLLFDSVLNISSIREVIVSILPITIIFIIVGILFQALSFFAVNIPYKKLFNKIKIIFYKIFKINFNIDEKECSLVMKQEEIKLTIFNSFLASFFTFSLALFTVLVCLSIGNVISNKLLILLQSNK